MAAKSSANIILRGYIRYVNCPSMYLNSSDCYSTEPCEETTIDLVCNMAVTGMDFTVHDDEVTATFDVTDLTGYTDPLTYLWTFDTSVFVATSPINQSTITLKLQAGKSFDYVVTPLTLTITDANRCTVTKTCYLVAGTMNCTTGYIPCPNPRELVVTNKFVQCSGPSGLIVKKK